MNDHDAIFDRNLERLLSESYQPENPDAAFVAGVEERMKAAAMERALRQLWESRLRRLRLRLSVAFALAAAFATVGLFVYAQKPPTPALPLQPTEKVAAATAPRIATDDSPGGRVAQPKPKAVPADAVAIGDGVTTQAGERRRVALPDGSVVFLNENTSVRLDAERRLTLEAGEVYVEVAPKDGERFVVSAPGIEAVALGTKFAVDAKGTVTVAQGKVRVNGLDSVVHAGQQLLPSATEPTPAPRVTSLLDWVRDAMIAADSPLIPKNQRASKLVAFNPSGQEAQISLRKFHVDVHIEDGFARTTIDQTYFNHENVQLEGTFHFPLPPDASLSRLAMYVNGDLMEGGMAERDHARNVYEEIRYNVRRDPALLEWVDGSTFKMRVFPMEARQEKRIIVSYTQRLTPLNGKSAYRFPMGHTLNETDSWSVNVRIKNAAGLNWTSPSHPLSAVMDGRDLLLSAEAKHAKLDRDLQVNLTEAAVAPPVKYTAMDHETDHYQMLRYRPNAADLHPAKVNPSKPRHYLFLFEASADRDPLLARTQIEIVRTMLDNLEHHDTFSVLGANTRARMIVADAPATPENIKKAVGAMERVHLIGALDLDQALALARESLKDRTDAWLVHVGSGVPTLGERREDVLARRVPAGVRYAGIGVGKRWSRSLMKTAADRTGGHFAQINPDEAITWKAFDFLATLRTPRWQNLRVTDDRDRSWLLHHTSLAAGEELCAEVRVGAAAAPAKSVTIRGIFDDKPFEQKIDLGTPQGPAGYLPRDWARLEIDRLLAEDSTKNKSAIVELSKAMYVISPYTSLLVLEDEAMYKRFNVDRGRKDHWAMYPCPAKIPVVYEPAGLVNSKPAPKPAVTAKTEEEILKSILIRGTPALVTTPGQPALPTMTAWERLQMNPGQPPWRGNPQLFAFYNGSDNREGVGIDPTGNDDANAKNNSANNEPGDNNKPIPTNPTGSQASGQNQGSKAHGNPSDPKSDNGQRNDKSAQKPDRSDPGDGKSDPRRDPDQGNRPQGSDIKARATNSTPGQALPDIRPGGSLNGSSGVFGNNSFGGGGQFGQMGQFGQGGANGFGGANGNFILNNAFNNSLVPQNGQVAGTSFGGGQGGFGGGGFGGGQGGFGGGFGGNFGNGNFGGFGGISGFGGNGGFGGMQGNFSGRGFGANPSLSLSGFQSFGWPPNGTQPLTAVPPAGWMWQPEQTIYLATTVRVREEMVAGAMVIPGARVDVICSTRLPTGKVVTDTILQNKLVIAVNRDRETTLAVTPQEARQLHAAGQRGEISFLLRSRDDDPMYVASLLPPTRTLNQLLYQRPAQGDVQAFFRDLVAFAPGLNTTDADIAAVLDAETGRVAPAPGKIDEDARRLLAKAHAAVWRKVKVGEGESAFTAECNGSGRFAFERKLPTGLTERVVCDGTTLWHMYPDLGLAAKRPFSPFHAAEWRALVPWVLPPVAELARGADVLRLSDSSVAIVPRGTATVKIRVHLTFGDNGLLRERTVVEMPSKKIISRVQYDAADYGDAISGSTITADVSKYVVLNLPYRTLAHVETKYGKKAFGNNTNDVGKLTDAQLADFLSASFAEGYREKQAHGTAASIIIYLADWDKRYTAKRPSLFVLLRMVPCGGYSDVFTPTGHPLVKYLQACGTAGEIGRFGQDGYFLQTLARLHDIYYQWHQTAGPDLGKDALARLRDFVERNRNGFGYAALVLASQRGDLTQDAWRGLAEAWQLFDHDKALGRLARFERVRCFLNGGMPNTARLTFDEMYRAALEVGELPPVDDTVKKLPVIDDGPWGEVLLRAAGERVAKGRPSDAVHLAWQALALGEPNLAQDLVGKALPKLPDAPPAVILDAVAFLTNTGKIALAQELIQPLLEHPRAGRLSEIWRAAADLAARRNQTRRMVEYLDRALEIEFERMPAEFDVRGPRAEYAALLAGFQQVASAHRQLESSLSAEFVARAVRAADRWRALDSDPTAACQAAARLLRDLDQPALAWDYLTSPVAFKPNEADPFKNLAQELATSGDSALAEKAYAAAFAAEPTNAELLWLRVGVLRQAGNETEALKVLRQIADGDWQPRFDWLKRQARQTLGR